MTDREVFRICPNCGSHDVPTLVVGSSAAADGGISWRCHTCDCSWTDHQSRLRPAS
jgi:formate dehydrogenase maturation protein FdhE